MKIPKRKKGTTYCTRGTSVETEGLLLCNGLLFLLDSQPGPDVKLIMDKKHKQRRPASGGSAT
jgi:hypothetical protein